MGLQRKLARNTAFVFLSGAATRVFSLVFVIYAARMLGPGDFGLYTVIGTLTFLFSFWGNFGVNMVAIREISKNRAGVEELFSIVLSLKMLLVIAAYPLLVPVVKLLGYGDAVSGFIYISAVATIFTVFSGSFGIIYMSFEQFRTPAVIAALVSLFQNIAGIVVLSAGLGLKGVIWVSFWTAVIGALVSGIWVRKKIIKYRFAFDTALTRDILLQSLPFASVAFFQQAGMYMNNLLLSKLSGPVPEKIAVGYYNASSSICRNAMLLPESFRQAAFPTVAANAGNTRAVAGIIDKSTKSFLVVIIFPLILATTFFPREIISLVFGKEYLAAAPVLMILGWAYALQIYNAPVSVTLAASKEIRQFVPWAALVFVINLVLAVPLIMHYSFTGAAWAFLISKVFETVIRHYLLHSIWGIKSSLLQMSLSRIFLFFGACLAIISGAKALAVPAGALLALTLVLYAAGVAVSRDFREGIVELVRGVRGRGAALGNENVQK